MVALPPAWRRYRSARGGVNGRRIGIGAGGRVKGGRSGGIEVAEPRCGGRSRGIGAVARGLAAGSGGIEGGEASRGG